MSKAASLAGFATAITPPSDLVVGIVTANSLTVSGNVSIAGTLTYEDVTNIDSLGIVTARTGINVLAGGITAVGVVTATTFSGDVTIGAGSTSAPSLAPSGDSNTGVFFPSADTIAFAEGGAEALRVNDRGQILLGVSGFAAATSPTASYTQYTPLHLIGGTGTNNGSSIFIARNTPSTNAVNQDLGSVIWGTNDGAPFARIGAWADGTPTGSSYPGYLSLQTTASGATTPTERVRITNDGAVLIGGSTNSSLNTSNDKVKFAVGGTGNSHTPTRGIWMSGTIPASTTYTVDLGQDQPSGFLVLTIASDPYAPTQPWSATHTQTQLYLVVPLRGGAAAGSKTLVSSIIRGTPHGTITWTQDGTKFTIQNTNGTNPLWYEVQYRI